MLSRKVREDGRFKRKRRIRKKIVGTAARPRLTVYRSNKNIYAQLVNDTTGHTLASASSLEDAVQGEDGSGKKGTAHAVGKLLAERAAAHGVSSVVFDRNGYIYHGRVAAVAEGAREGGLQF